MSNKRALICFSGIDGSGKSTIAKEMALTFGDGLIYVWARWEPFLLAPFVYFLNAQTSVNRNQHDRVSYNVKKNMKKSLLSNKIIRATWLFLAELDYLFQLIIKVAIPLFRNKLVICDRYIYDFYIDQLINMNIPATKIGEYANKRMLSIFPNPDIVIYIKIQPKTGVLRKNDGTAVEYLIERKEYYDALKNVYRTIEIDGEQPLREVASNIRNVVEKVVSKTYV